MNETRLEIGHCDKDEILKIFWCYKREARKIHIGELSPSHCQPEVDVLRMILKTPLGEKRLRCELQGREYGDPLGSDTTGGALVVWP